MSQFFYSANYQSRNPLGQHTPLHQKHLDAGAKMIDFAGWDMPVNYGSQIEEHNCVRATAGVFDVSHMTVVDISGDDAKSYLRKLLANDVDKLNETGRALYSAMLNENGGVVDDLIVYSMSFGFRLVLNCTTREKDLAWMAKHSVGFDVSIVEKPEYAMLAVHGPESIDKVCYALDQGQLYPAKTAAINVLGNFCGVELGHWFIARTGYTGEKGLELIIPAAEVPVFWDKLLAAGVKPIGLGARDSLRLEAGMNLYGHDMDEETSPLAANMEQTIAWQPQDRDFVGRSAVTRHRQEQAAGSIPRLVGLVLEQRGVLREGQKIVCENGQGTITSGGFSPTLKHSIALARIPTNSHSCQAEIRGTLTPVRIVKPNFVRFGKKVFE